MKRILIKIAKETGKLLAEQFDLEHSREIHEVKGKNDVATKTDILAENLIIQRLKENDIKCTVISEEAGRINLGGSEYNIYIDPLDGTMNFLNKIPIYVTMLAVEKNNEIITGIVYNPNTKELTFAEKNKGTFINNKRVKVRGKNSLDDAILEFDYYWSDSKKSMDVFLKCVVGRQMRKFNCIGYEYSLLASGKIDVIAGNWSTLHDMSPGKIIIEEAGGKFIDFSGKPWNKESGNVIAANPKLADQLVEILRD